MTQRLTFDSDINQPPRRKKYEGLEIVGKTHAMSKVFCFTSNDDYQAWFKDQDINHPKFNIYEIRRVWDEYAYHGNDGWQNIIQKEHEILKELNYVDNLDLFETMSKSHGKVVDECFLMEEEEEEITGKLGTMDEHYELMKSVGTHEDYLMEVLWSSARQFCDRLVYWMSEEQYQLMRKGTAELPSKPFIPRTMTAEEIAEGVADLKEWKEWNRVYEEEMEENQKAYDQEIEEINNSYDQKVREIEARIEAIKAGS